MEAVGAAASCIQLIEIAGRTLISISKLYRRARDAPKEIQRVSRQLDQLITLVTLLQPYFSLHAPTTGTNGIKSVIQDCIDQAEQLAKLIDVYTKDEPVWKRGWHNLKALSRQEQVTLISNHLERHKSNLLLWVSITNQASLARVESTILDISLTRNDLPSDEVIDMQTKRLPKSYKANHDDEEPTTTQVEGRSIKRAPRSRYSSVNCTCSARHIVKSWNFVNYVHLRSSIIKHQPSCPCADIIERRFFVPNSLFSYALNGSFVTYTVNGRSSLSQTFSCNRIVDEKSSPAFRLFTQFYEPKDSSPTQRQLLSKLNTKYNAAQTIESLSHCFRTAQASPFDINEYGQTLITACLQLFWTLFQHNLLEDYDGMAKTVRYLTQAGVPLNEHGLYEGSAVSMISTLEENLMSRDVEHGDSKQLLLVKHFLSAGGDYEEDDDFVQYKSHNLGCALFSTLPEFIEAANISQAHIAVMNGDLERLERIIKAGGELNQVNTWGAAPVLYARNHAPALKMLLDAGADPNPVNKGGWNALSGAAAWYNSEAVTMLLNADVAIIGLETLFGILSVREVGMQTGVLDALSNRRSRLRHFAQWHLTDPKWDYLELEKARPLDSKALEVSKALEDMGVEIPASLLVYWNRGELRNDRPEPVFVQAITRSSTYHLEPIQIKTDQLLVFLDNIYASGFHEVDSYNSQGFTPLLMCSSKAQWEVADWLLERMDLPPSTMRQSTLNALHCFAQNLGETFQADKPERPKWIGGFLQRLRKAGVQIEQTVIPLGEEFRCEPCSCCPDGQTPTVTLTKLLATSITAAASTAVKQSPLFEEALKETLTVWKETFGDETSSLEIMYRYLVRQEMFNQLEMTHTCLDLRSIMEGQFPTPPFDQDETREIRDEEEELGCQLDDLMHAYDVERQKYEGNIEDFHRDWVAGLPR